MHISQESAIPSYVLTSFAHIAQLARASRLHREGPWFESKYVHQSTRAHSEIRRIEERAARRHVVEHLVYTEKVLGSSPCACTFSISQPLATTSLDLMSSQGRLIFTRLSLEYDKTVKLRLGLVCTLKIS